MAGPTPSKPMVKLFWDKLPERQVCLRELYVWLPLACTDGIETGMVHKDNGSSRGT